MIYYFKPYNLSGSLFEAYRTSAAIVPNPDDWICFLDGDTLFLSKNWGHIIDRYIKAYPETGLFTSYASRCSYIRQIPRIGNNINSDMKFHILVSRKLERFASNLDVKDINDKIAGHLMLIKKSTWMEIESEVSQIIIEKNKTILGVDTAISKTILKHGKRILLMKAIYLLHLFRMDGRKH